jgi:hypothetical protein
MFRVAYTFAIAQDTNTPSVIIYHWGYHKVMKLPSLLAFRQIQRREEASSHTEKDVKASE